MIWSWGFCVQIYKPEFKVNKGLFYPIFFSSIDHSRTVHSVQSSSTLFMVLPHTLHSVYAKTYSLIIIYRANRGGSFLASLRSYILNKKKIFLKILWGLNNSVFKNSIFCCRHGNHITDYRSEQVSQV